MWDFIWRVETLWALLLLLYIPCCIGLIIVVLLQKGKGTSFAGAFGIGAGADTVFGPRGSRSLPARVTQIMAAIFMVMALVMSMLSGRVGKGIAPGKVSITETTKESEQGTYDSLLDDVGSAIEEKAEKAVSEPAGVTETPESAPVEGTAQPVAPAETPGQLTVTAPAETAPAEGAGTSSAAESPTAAQPAAEAPAHSEGQPASPAGGS